VKSEMFQIIDPKGRPTTSKLPDLKAAALKKIYALMMTTRLADDKSIKLQRQGRMGTLAPSLGHEASQVGAAWALEKEDWFFPYFRDLGSFLTRGFPLENYYAYWMGNEKGMAIPESQNIFPLSVPVASQIPHAVGAAMAAKLKGRAHAVLCTFGDGATSQGDFHEALNFAGVYQTANVFVCYNNQYAISLPREKQTASATLAQKAEAYGFPGVLVDGNDVLAMYVQVDMALTKARKGGGPTLIEAYTYRLSNHTTSDDAGKYRSEKETRSWEDRDPLKRFRRFLEDKKLWNPGFEEKVRAEAEVFIDAAVQAAENLPPPTMKELFSYTYATLPPHLKEQLEAMRAFQGETKS
jgi:pyruvate dehydrogenase E1 component alpha subunit